ncbi:hypothetical protein GCM10023222_23050 [Saccharopolyspora cebuensis]
MSRGNGILPFLHWVHILSPTTAAAPPPGERKPAMSEDSTARTSDTEPTVDEELLVEEVSIDGMCGVY